MIGFPNISIVRAVWAVERGSEKAIGPENLKSKEVISQNEDLPLVVYLSGGSRSAETKYLCSFNNESGMGGQCENILPSTVLC